MLSIGIVEVLMRKITLVFAYLLTASVVGYSRTWIALRVTGNAVSADDHDATWNPMAHIDPIGFCVLLFFNVGWLKSLFIDRSSIFGRFVVLRGLLATYADTLVHIVFTVIGIVILTFFYGPIAQSVLSCTIIVPNFSYYYHFAQQSAAGHSSLALAVSFIFFAFTQLNMVLAGLTFAFNSVRYAFFPHRDSFLTYNPVVYIFVSLVFFLIVVTPVTQLVLHSGVIASKCLLT